MKRPIAWPLMAIVLVTGCDAVYTRQPIGDEPLALETAQWQGTWLNGEVVMLTTVLDADNGKLQTAWLERGETGARMEVVVGEVRHTGERVYINSLDEPDEADESAPESGSPPYYWARIRVEERTMTVWMPRLEAFRKAVEEGRLPGRIDADENVVLDRLEPDHLALIDSPEANLLQWSEPLVLVRVGD